MDIVIRSHLAATELLAREPERWDTVVVLDSTHVPTDFVGKHARSHLFVRFDDVVGARSNKRTVTSQDVGAVLEHAPDSKHMLLTCRAGQSRSSALGFLVAATRLGEEPALNLLDPTRHVPNGLVLEVGAGLIDEVDVLTLYERWMLANAHVDIWDHIAELEREVDELESRGVKNQIVAP